MKLYIVLCVFVIIGYISTVSSVPYAAYDGPTYELKRIQERDADPDDIMPDADLDDSLSRPRRVTCDVLSWQSKWFSFNHSACALRCLTQKRRGGRCQNGVCVCR
ncbi:defensin 2 [Nomia melanderi]|uniref:defensin 2 n=1 Tax=Nomia melanderi TaxID=2448451 RepID=UPI0013046A21|nr:defensin-2-like [Nomia melanderi]